MAIVPKRRKPSQEELVERIRERQATDIVGVEMQEYVPYLDDEHARALFPQAASKLKSIEAREWKEEDICRSIEEYLKMAFDWANRAKDFETLRAMSRLAAMLWILGERELCTILESFEWTHFGKMHFRMIAEHFGVDWEKLDDGVLMEMPDVGQEDEVTIRAGDSQAMSSLLDVDIADEAWGSAKVNSKPN